MWGKQTERPRKPSWTHIGGYPLHRPDDRGDIAAHGFWKRGHTAIFDVPYASPIPTRSRTGALLHGRSSVTRKPPKSVSIYNRVSTGDDTLRLLSFQWTGSMGRRHKQRRTAWLLSFPPNGDGMRIKPSSLFAATSTFPLFVRLVCASADNGTIPFANASTTGAAAMRESCSMAKFLPPHSTAFLLSD